MVPQTANIFKSKYNKKYGQPVARAHSRKPLLPGVLLKIRLAFVGYRDHCDGDDRVESMDFTDDEQAVIDFIDSMEADGGMDDCEDVFGGLEEVITLDWANPIRVLIHIGDAPQHGRRFHDKRVSDSYARFNDVDPRGLRVEELLANLKYLKINYFFGKMNATTDIMIKEFCDVINDDNFIRQIDISNPKNINSLLVTSISSSLNSQICDILTSRSTSTSLAAFEVKKFSVVKEKPNLMNTPVIEVKWLECVFPVKNLNRIKDCIENIEFKWRKDFIKMAENPFAEGGHRISYHGLRGDVAEDIVVKDFKAVKKGGKDFREECIRIMEAQGLAAFMASEFNKIAQRSAEKINFIEVGVIETFASNGSPIFYNTEKLLPSYQDKFTKWCDNAGNVNLKQIAASLDAFCHWTYEITGGYLMVVDIQGVKTTDGYVLTDPSIHCLDDKFGSMNFGDIGMKTYFRTHTCNQICKQLMLKSMI